VAPRQHLNEGRSAPTAVPAPSRWWLVGYVAATFLAFPHPLRLSIFGEGAVLDLGLLVSWAVAPLLILGIEGLSQKRAVWAGFLATVAAHGLVLHFIYVVTVYYGHAPVAVGVIAPFALACYAGVLGALFAAAWVPLRAMGLGGPFTAALLWTVLDYLRSFAFTGWPWATLGYAQHLNPALLGIAQFTAVYGLSFATVLGGCGVAWLVRTRGRGPESRVGWAALAVVVLLHVAGFTLRIVPGQNDGMAETPLRVAAIQGNIEQGQKWDPENYRRTLDQYERLTRQAADQGAEIIVWPETAVPGVLEAQPTVAEWLERLALETGAVLLVGAVGADFDSGSGEIRRFYDSAFLFGPLAGKVERYDKTHLVPFGEYVPLRRMLGGLLGAVASGIATGDVTPGDEPRALDFERPAEIARAGAWTSVRLGTPICYELLFPDLVRKFVSDGGGMLLAITNDAWYGRTGAPYQFLAITTLRSAETGVFIVRAANTGVSAVIDSGGWVREQIPIFEPGILVADVPVRAVGPGDKPSAGTFYVRHGDVFAQSSCLLLLAMAFTAGVRRRRGSAAAGQV
jgi:apolipoprotein N-acyltransferase